MSVLCRVHIRNQGGPYWIFQRSIFCVLYFIHTLFVSVLFSKQQREHQQQFNFIETEKVNIFLAIIYAAVIVAFGQHCYFPGAVIDLRKMDSVFYPFCPHVQISFFALNQKKLILRSGTILLAVGTSQLVTTTPLPLPLPSISNIYEMRRKLKWE